MKIEKIILTIEYDTDSDPMERRSGEIHIPDPGIATDVSMCIRMHMGDALKKFSSRRVFAQERNNPFPGTLRELITRHGWKVKPRVPGDLLSGLLYVCPDCKKSMVLTEFEKHIVKCGRGTPCNVVGCCVPDKAKKKRIEGKTKTFRKLYGKKKKVKQDPYLKGISERDARNEDL